MCAFHTIGRWVAWWAALVGFYLLLVMKLAWPEAVAGAVAAALGATGATAAAGAGRLHFRPRLRWLRHLIGIPWRVLADCGIVAAALGRALVLRQPVEGEFRTIPFEPGDGSGESAARRALVAVGVSLAPNTFVVAVDREHRLLLVHQLVPSARPPGGGDREWPL
jgi:multisubunit Na+/H+ antiporter MnhE subunit